MTHLYSEWSQVPRVILPIIAPPERGTVFMLQVHIRVEISRGKVKVKSAYRPIGPSGRSLSHGFCSMMKRLGVFPLAGMLVHRRVPASDYERRYPFVLLGGERHCDSKVSSPRTQHNVSGQGSNPDRRPAETNAL